MIDDMRIRKFGEKSMALRSDAPGKRNAERLACPRKANAVLHRRILSAERPVIHYRASGLVLGRLCPTSMRQSWSCAFHRQRNRDLPIINGG
jgi:hypothetical protein